MHDERCENCDGPKVPIGCWLNYHCIIASADCWSRSGVTLLTLLSFYTHTNNKHISFLIEGAQNRAIMGSVNSVYTRRVDAGAVRRTAWCFATEVRTAPRSSPASHETAENVAATVPRKEFPELGRTEGVGS